jgi:hypothetical protein
MKPYENDVAEILAAHRAPVQGAEAVDRLQSALRREMADQAAGLARFRRQVVARIVLAGLLALPVLIGLNVGIAYGLEAVYETIFPHAVASVLVVLFAIWTLMGLSLTYGSLPIIGAVAMKMRGERYVTG